MINSPKKPIKVALVGYKLANGGLERVFGNTTKLLHDAGIEVHTLVLENKTAYCQKHGYDFYGIHLNVDPKLIGLVVNNPSGYEFSQSAYNYLYNKKV